MTGKAVLKALWEQSLPLKVLHRIMQAIRTALYPERLSPGAIHQQMNLLPVLPALRPPQRFLPALPHLLSIPVIHIMNPPCRFW